MQRLSMKTKPHPVYIVSLKEHEFNYDVFIAMEMCDGLEPAPKKDMDMLSQLIMKHKYLQKKDLPFIWYGEYKDNLVLNETYKQWAKTLTSADQKILLREVKHNNAFGLDFNKNITVNDQDLVFNEPCQMFVFMLHNNLNKIAIAGCHIVGCINDFNNDLQLLCKKYKYPIQCFIIKELSK